MWVADKVTTILSNASSDRIHVRTLIGVAQLFYDFGKTVVPTHLLLFGLPRSVASAEIFQEVRVYRLVHLRQLHGARRGKQVLGDVRRPQLHRDIKGLGMRYAPVNAEELKC